MDKFALEKTLAKEFCIRPEHVSVVGSTLICGKGNDTDFLVLLPDALANDTALARFGFVSDVELSYESPLRSYRREKENLIVTTDERFFFAEVAIANAAKVFRENKSALDMSDRDDRIRFHSEVREAVLWRLAEVSF